jgi:hypothetical protein
MWSALGQGVVWYVVISVSAERTGPFFSKLSETGDSMLLHNSTHLPEKHFPTAINTALLKYIQQCLTCFGHRQVNY